MSRFIIEQTPITGLQVIQRQPRGDERGYLERMFCADELKAIIDDRSIVQINHTITSKSGTVRGMHYQHPPYAEMKLVSCLRGEVFDVAVDLRKDSPTFMQWHAEILSEENHRTFAIPEGFAHGFQALADNVELLYLHSEFYSKEYEGGLLYDDKTVNIDWPLTVTEISERDKVHPMLSELNPIML